MCLLFSKAFWGNILFFSVTLPRNDLKCINNSFIRQIVQTWSYIVFTGPNNNYGSQIIWNDSHFLVNGNIVMCKQLFKDNVIYERDIFDQNSMPLSFDQFKRNFQIASIPFKFMVYWR